MKTLYFECNMGAAGDMLAASLYELLEDKAEFLRKISESGLEGVEITPQKSEKCGIVGTHIKVTVHGETEGEHDRHEHHHSHHYHSGIDDIYHIIDRLNVNGDIKENAKAVYKLIAEAESAVHGREITDIHFHEVGTMDAVADVVCVCMLIDMIKPDKIIASPVNTGSGTVRCAHGILPVPAPATERILRGIPVYQGSVKSELCTPTGAALLKHFVKDFCAMPVMRIANTGYGMGCKDFDEANCVRAVLGESDDECGKIIELSCNIDDMTGEELAFAAEELMRGGALDVYTTAITMKKGRPAVMLSCLCDDDNKDKLLKLIFKHTSTLGVRENKMNRYRLHREQETLSTQYGDIRIKKAYGYGTKREKAEYEDLAEIARRNGTGLRDIVID